MTRADYDYKILKKNIPYTFLLIEDLDKGNCSVTNDIYNVVKEIINIQGKELDINNTLILYLDSNKIWDGYNYTNDSFIAIGKSDYRDAIQTYLEKINLDGTY